MIDFHNHILPGVDDGATSIEMSIEMLKVAQKQGITDIVSTVHYQHPKMDGKNTDFQFIKHKADELQKIIYDNKINIKIHISAEVFFLPNLTKIIDNPLVTIGNGKFMLIEFQTRSLPPNYLSELYKLQNKRVTPIIAHPERYVPVQDNLDLAEDWIRRGFILQLDGGSLLGHFGKKCQQISMELMERGYIQLIGSDAHNNKIRNFCLKEAYDKVERLYSPEIVQEMKYNCNLLLEGKKLQIIEPGSSIKDKEEENMINKLIKLIKWR